MAARDEYAKSAKEGFGSALKVGTQEHSFLPPSFGRQQSTPESAWIRK